MILLLFGPPGSGKGTQSRLITSWLGIPGISTGDMLRAEIQAGTDLGRVAQSIMASGGLVGDDLVNQMLEKRVSQPDAGRGFLLDGYPRTVEQATFLDRLIERRRWPKPVILHLDVPMDALLGRLTARRQCPKCGTIYNLQYQPPKKPGICDLDGTPLITRTDDEKDVVADRLRTYTTLSRPVLAHYKDADYHDVRGDASPECVFEAITSVLESRISKNGTRPAARFVSTSGPAAD